MPSLPLDPETDRALQNLLEPGETVRWSTRPLPRSFVVRAAPAIGYGLVLVGMAAWFLAENAGIADRRALGSAAVLPSLLMAAITVAIGLALLGSPLLAIRLAKRAAYAVTDRRAIILLPRAKGDPDVMSFPPSRLGVAEEMPRPDGTGDVVLGTVLVRTPLGRGNRRLKRIGFFAVPDVAEAFGAVGELAKGVPRGGAAPASASAPLAVRALGPAFILLLGGAILWLGARQFEAARRSASWPTAQGTIVSSTRQIVRARHPHARARIVYFYEVDNRMYYGRRVAFGDVSSPARVAELLSRYPAGVQVSVSYDPSEPRDSVLEPGVDPGAGKSRSLGLLTLLLGASLAWNTCSGTRRRPVVSSSGRQW